MNLQIESKNHSFIATGNATEKDIQGQENIHDIIDQIQKSKEDILNCYDQIESHLLGTAHKPFSSKQKNQKYYSNPRSNRSAGRSTKTNIVSSFQDNFDFKIDSQRYSKGKKKFQSPSKGKQNVMMDHYKTSRSAARSKQTKYQTSNYKQNILRQDSIHQQYLKKLSILKQERKKLQQINQQNRQNIIQKMDLLQMKNTSNILIQNHNTFDNFSILRPSSPAKTALKNYNKDFMKNIGFEEQNVNYYNTYRPSQKPYQQQNNFQISLRNSPFVKSTNENYLPYHYPPINEAQKHQFQNDRNKKNYSEIKNQIWKNWENQCGMFSKINLNNSPQFKSKLSSRFRKHQTQDKREYKSSITNSKIGMNQSKVKLDGHKNSSNTYLQNSKNYIQYSQNQLNQGVLNPKNSNDNNDKTISGNKLKIDNLKKLIQNQKQNSNKGQNLIQTQRIHDRLRFQKPQNYCSPIKDSIKSLPKGPSVSAKKKQSKPAKILINSEPMKNIHNRIQLSKLIFQDSIKRNDQHQRNHLYMTYDKQKRERSQICQKICQQPAVLKKFKKNFTTKN